ncbi:hypothetical protein [Azospirillum formosense]|uniref:hypothetical protein n=1 Tax=Azospirillum formosense TaxID=861533 RepID=UPI00338F28A3
MEVLIFQIVIIFSLNVAYWFGSDVETGLHYVMIVACCWTVETLLLLFFPPLIVVQLAVIWGTVLHIRRRAQGKVLH